jgi:putative hydrolase of the HAD superfamily
MKNIIFDVGGVITDFSPFSLKRYLKIPIKKVKELSSYIYNSDEWKECIKGNITQEELIDILHSKNVLDRDILDKFLLSKNQKHILPVRDEMLHEINKLKKKYKIYLLSNMSKNTHKYLSELGIIELFDGGVYSYECGQIKPHRGIYELLLKRYGLNREECIFFDDVKMNVDTGNKIGIKSILYKDINDLKNNVDY